MAGRRRGGFDPNQRRDRRGRWSDGGTLTRSSHVGATRRGKLVTPYGQMDVLQTPITRAKGRGVRGRVRAARENRTIPAREQASVDRFVAQYNRRVDRRDAARRDKGSGARKVANLRATKPGTP